MMRWICVVMQLIGIAHDLYLAAKAMQDDEPIKFVVSIVMGIIYLESAMLLMY